MRFGDASLLATGCDSRGASICLQVLGTLNELIMPGCSGAFMAEVADLGFCQEYLVDRIRSGQLSLDDICFTYDDTEARELLYETAGEPSAPVATLELLARYGDKKIRKRIAGNPSVSPDTLDWLAWLGEKGVCKHIASNPSASSSVLEWLAVWGEVGVYERVARNPSAPEVDLRHLARDSDPDVRGTVADGPSTSEAVLRTMVNDKDIAIRMNARLKILRESLDWPPRRKRQLLQNEGADS